MVALEKAIRLSPSLAVAQGNKAIALAMLGRFDEADQAVRLAVVLGHKNVKGVRERVAALKLV